MSSINMNMPIPGVGITSGPQWATDVNSCLTIIDSHDHSAGYGVQITPSGININSDFSLNLNNLTSARSLRMTEQALALSNPTDIDCLYDVLGDLYFNDGAGNQIQITQGGGIAGTPGSIANLTSPASASYVAADQTFVWQSDVNKPANMDAAAYIFRNLTTSSFGVTVSPPNSLGANYALVLPSLPASQKFMTLDASGNMSAPWVVDSSTIEVSSNTVQVKNLGITQAQLATAAVTTTKISDGNVTTAKIADANVTKPKLAALGQQLSGSSGSFTTTSTVYIDITNLTVTLTTTGRSVSLGLISDQGVLSYIFVEPSGGTPVGVSGQIKLVRVITDLSIQRYGAGGAAAAGVAAVFPVSSFNYIDSPSAGTYTYKIQALAGGGSRISVIAAKLIAFEL